MECALALVQETSIQPNVFSWARSGFVKIAAKKSLVNDIGTQTSSTVKQQDLVLNVRSSNLCDTKGSQNKSSSKVAVGCDSRIRKQKLHNLLKANASRQMGSWSSQCARQLPLNA